MLRLVVPAVMLGLLASAQGFVLRAGGEREASGSVQRTVLLGRSALGRPIRAIELGDPTGAPVLVVGCIHGDECAGTAAVRALTAGPPVEGVDLWLLPNLNPDGRALGTRLNGRGVDLNRNFPSEWRPIGRPWDPQYSGPRPFSEPESRVARALVLRLRPAVTIWFHQPQGLVRAWGGSVPTARRFAQLAGLPFRRIRWPAGTAPNWQNHRFPGTSSFVVELPPGQLARADARRLATAIRRLASEVSEPEPAGRGSSRLAAVEDGVSFGKLGFDSGERFQRLRGELGVTTFGLNLIVLQPGQRGRIHRHERQEEVYVVLEGTLSLVIEGEERDLNQGELVRVAQDVRRQLVNRGPGRLALLAVGGAEPHDGRDGIAYESWSDLAGRTPQELPLPEDLAPHELRLPDAV